MPFILGVLSFVMFCNLGHAQDYGEYNEYQVFSDGKYQSRHWGFIIMPSFVYWKVEEDNRVSGEAPFDRGETFTFYDIKVGHVFRHGFYAGFNYAGETQKSGSDIYTATRRSFGISGGFLYKGWTLLLHYYFYSLQEIDYNSVQRTHDEWAKGSGFQIDGGYLFRINHRLSIGPMLVYKNFNYKEGEDAVTQIDEDSDSNHRVLIPMVSLVFTVYP